jgi:hypothetical protein
MAGRNLHRRLVGLHGDQALLGLDGVAGLDQQLDDRHLGKITDVRHFDFNQAHVCLQAGGARPAFMFSV